MKMKRLRITLIIIAFTMCFIAGCGRNRDKITELSGSAEQSESAAEKNSADGQKEQSKADGSSQSSNADDALSETIEGVVDTGSDDTDSEDTDSEDIDSDDSGSEDADPGKEISLDPSWEYAEFSKINSGTAVLYRSASDNPKGKVVCVNAGHGTDGGESVTTQCHPDGSAKVVSGSTSAGSVRAAAVSSGMSFEDGTPESEVTLKQALILKEDLLENGYDVLMIRETDDVQLDNIARTVIANQNADCHIALHWDSGSSDKGAFYISAPKGSYREMEPVASHWQEHEALGQSLIDGLEASGVSVFSDRKMEIDLTQTSYSTIPSIDIELGDAASDHGSETLKKISDGLVKGVDHFFE